MSRADFWATMGTVALRLAAKNQGGGRPFIPHFKFYFGRKDCCHDKAPDHNDAYESPNPYGNTVETVLFLMRHFNLPIRHAIALLGSHTLGKAKPRNSGFSGAWSHGKEIDGYSMYTLDNMYYRNLVDPRLLW